MRRIAAFAGATALVAATVITGVMAQTPRGEHQKLDPKVQEAMHLAMDADKILRAQPKDKAGHLEKARTSLHDAIHELETALQEAR